MKFKKSLTCAAITDKIYCWMSWCT